MSGRQGDTPDVSGSFDPIEMLLRARALFPPNRPGVLACLDRFEVVGLVGTGGMSVVLLARDPRATDPVAIKLLKPELTRKPYAVHRFLVEARHMQRLSHPNILHVLEVSDRPEGPYFVAPYLSRGSVAQMIKPGLPLDEVTVLGIARDVAEALSHAHAKGIIHGDLKPGNILIAQDGRACLADFGLGRSFVNDSFIDVRRSQREGTVAYMSPAVAAGQAEDTRRDIYALGAVIYEMLTGRPPYSGDSPGEILDAIAAGPPTPIRRLNPNASQGLVSIAEGAMARQLRDRYAHIDDLIADLDRFERGARPLGPHQVGRRKPLVRKTAAAMAALAAIVAIIAAVAVLLRDNAGASAEGTPDSTLRLVREISLPDVGKWSSSMLGEWDGDGEPDIFNTLRRELVVVSSHGQELARWQPRDDCDDLGLGLLADTDDDGVDELFVNQSIGSDLFISVFNQNFYELKRFHAQGHSGKETGSPYGSGIQARMLVDLENDGARELIARVATGYGLAPRGVYCFNYEDGSVLWKHLTGPGVSEIALVDVTGDGRLDLVFGSRALYNGNSAADGTDDFHCYVYAVSHDGRLLWVVPLDEVFTSCSVIVADLNRDGNAEIIAWASGNYPWQPEAEYAGSVFQILYDGTVAARYDAGAQIHSCAAVDLYGEGTLQVIAADRRGFLHVLGPDLALRKRVSVVSSKYNSLHLGIEGVADLNLDGRAELVLSCMERESVSGNSPGTPSARRNVRFYHNNRVIVLSPELDTLASFVLADVWKIDPGLSVMVSDLDADAAPEILTCAYRALILRFPTATDPR